jgi:hypothetical protein
MLGPIPIFYQYIVVWAFPCIFEAVCGTRILLYHNDMDYMKPNAGHCPLRTHEYGASAMNFSPPPASKNRIIAYSGILNYGIDKDDDF